MGQCTKTKFCYGFILPQKQLVKLFAALQDGDNEIQEFLDWDELQELQDLVSPWLESEVPAFEFVVKLTSDDDGDEEECEMMFCYQGKYNEEDKQDGEQSGVFSLEIWGRESNKTSLEVIPQPWEDEAFMKGAREAFNQIAEKTSFKDTRIPITPQWFHYLSVG